MNFNDYDEKEIEIKYLQAGVYLTKITDVEVTEINEKWTIRLKFVCDEGEHNETFFITEKTLWKFRKLLRDLQLTVEEKADIDIKDEKFPERDIDYIYMFAKKHLCGRLVKIKLTVSDYNDKYLNIEKIRPLTDDETKKNENLKEIKRDYLVADDSETQQNSNSSKKECPF